MLELRIHENEAMERAASFLTQHYSVIKVEKPVLEGNVWTVEVHTSGPNQRKFRIKVNVRTGEIQGF
jgi:hypothetical protein